MCVIFGLTQSVRLSVCPSFPHPVSYGAGWIHFIFKHLIQQLRKVCRMLCVMQNFKFCHFYAPAFRRRRHYVFGLSVRPSVRRYVRPKPEIPSFDLYMGPLVHPINRNHFTACPSVRMSVRMSVRPSVRRGFRAFVRECMEGLAWSFTCWCILTIIRTD